MADDIDEMLDSLDRKASVGMAMGKASRIVLDPMDLRQMVKAVRVCRERAEQMHAVSLRMNDAITRAEWWMRVFNAVAWGSGVIALVMAALAMMAG